MEHVVRWHHGVPTAAELELALAELEQAAAELAEASS
jgi:hypothetical protein